MSLKIRPGFYTGTKLCCYGQRQVRLNNLPRVVYSLRLVSSPPTQLNNSARSSYLHICNNWNSFRQDIHKELRCVRSVVCVG